MDGILMRNTANRQGAAVLASLRNLANGVYELQKEQKRRLRYPVPKTR
jgi:hypothetical protein